MLEMLQEPKEPEDVFAVNDAQAKAAAERGMNPNAPSRVSTASEPFVAPDPETAADLISGIAGYTASSPSGQAVRRDFAASADAAARSRAASSKTRKKRGFVSWLVSPPPAPVYGLGHP
jgi:hypothetical protein